MPGLSEPAGEYTELMGRLLPRRCVAISPRGRGRSDAPASGYTLDDHAGDVLAVARQATLPRCVLVAFSRGVPYAIRCATIGSGEGRGRRRRPRPGLDTASSISEGAVRAIASGG